MGTYKDSGIEWIGEIPEEWNTDIAKNIFKEHKLRNDKNLENNLLSLSYGKIVQKDIESLAGLIPESFSTYNIIQKDDIVLRLTDLQNDKRSLRTALCKEDRGIITSAYLTLRLNTNNNASYLHYLLHSYDVCKVFYNLGGGVRLGGSWSDVGKLHLLLPPLQEQVAIADFLDKKNAEIDAIISKITQQIQTLKDYRQSLITQTVTKGLDKTAAYKDSGIDILGYINRDYEIIRLRYLCNFTTGSQDTQDADEDGQYNFYVRSPKILRTNKIDFNGTAILMAGDGVGAGKIFHYAEGEFGVHQRVYILHNFKRVNPKFLHRYMSSLFSIEIEKGSAKSTVDSIRLPMLQNFNVVVPPFQEQAAIADYLDEKTAKIDCIIAKKEQQLELIKEHRKSLIYEYVTGKKRVKEY